MKKLFFILTAIATATLITSCAREIVSNEGLIPEENTIDLIIDAGVEVPATDDTKTYISGTSIKWASSGEKIKVYELATTSGADAVKAVASGNGTSTDSYETISFPVTLAAGTADNYKYYANYPNSAWVSNSSTAATANIETKDSQTPTATSFDPSADLLIAKEVDNGGSQPTSLSMQFARTVAIGKMTITNLPTDEIVNKVTFSADNGSAVVLAGRTTFNLATAQPVSDYGDMVSKTSLEINTAGLGSSAETSLDVFFTCYPFELASGDSFSVVVETETYVVSRTVTIPAARELNFIAGIASRFSVNMSTADVEKMQAWKQYSGDFSAGDYLIVYSGKAMTAGTDGTRFTYSSVTASGDEIFTNRADMVWRAAASSAYWTLYSPELNKYAASTGEKNAAQFLDSGTDDMSLWTVTGSSTYEFVNKKNTANGVNANLRYNSGNGFACYSTGTGGALTLYKKDTRSYLAAPASVSASLNGSDGGVIDVTFSSVANAGSYVITAKPSAGAPVVKDGVTSSPATISVAEDDLAYETEYTISVYAVPSDEETYRNSLAKKAANTVTTGERPVPTTGTMVWCEDFSGWAAWTNTASGASHVYGGGTVDYSSSTSCTFQKDDNLAGGSKPEILIKKNSDGKFIVKDIPITKATSATLFYNSNYDYCALDNNVGATVTAKSYNTIGPKVKVWEITSIPADTDYIDLTLTNTNAGSNCRADNFVLKAGTKSFQPLSYASPSVNWVIGTDCTVDVAADAPQSPTGASTTLSYSSSDATVATVNSSTGAITVKKAGSVTITVAAAETASYWSSVTSYTLTISEAGGPVLSWSRPENTDIITSGFTALMASETKTGYRQDGSGTLRYVGAYHKTNKLFTSTPASVTVTAVIGGGSTKDPLGNNVCVCFVDKSGNDIADSDVTLTTKVEETTGKSYTVSMSPVKAVDAYGIKIYHTKETSFNVRYYSFSVEGE